MPNQGNIFAVVPDVALWSFSSSCGSFCLSWALMTHVQESLFEDPKSWRCDSKEGYTNFFLWSCVQFSGGACPWVVIVPRASFMNTGRTYCLYLGYVNGYCFPLLLGPATQLLLLLLLCLLFGFLFSSALVTCHSHIILLLMLSLWGEP